MTILENLALINLNGFCKEHGIDNSGTHLVKQPSRYMWSLANNKTGRTLITISFKKSSVPLYTIDPEYKETK